MVAVTFGILRQMVWNFDIPELEILVFYVSLKGCIQPDFLLEYLRKETSILRKEHFNSF